MADLTYVADVASDEAGLSAATQTMYPRQLYPEIEANDSGHLDVGDGHEMYWEESGQTGPDAPVALFLHGGPGGGTSPRVRRFFDPSFYRIILIDQRGSGNSKPNASNDWEKSIHENNTAKLIGDIELLRKKLNIEKFYLVQGGSWGSTLTLCYAEAHPDRVTNILLRGTFLFTPEEVGHLFQNGSTASQSPEAWHQYTKYIEDTSTNIEAERKNYLGAYLKRLRSDEATRNAAAAAFIGYELSISKCYANMDVIAETLANPTKLIPFAMFEVIYMLNGGFLRRGQILDEVDKLVEAKHKVRMVHGRCDYVCQPQSSFVLANALKEAGMPEEDVIVEFVSGAGHSNSEPGITDALVRATDYFRDLYKK